MDKKLHKRSRTLRLVLLLFLGCAALTCVANLRIDPFGVFGDPLLHWYEYDMTSNPRVAKIEYLQANRENYDSFVLGCDNASALPVDALEGYMGGSFFNLCLPDDDLKDAADALRWLTETGEVKSVVLCLSPRSAAAYDVGSILPRSASHPALDGSSPFLHLLRYLFANPFYSAKKVVSYLRRGYLPGKNACVTAQTGCRDRRVEDALPLSDGAGAQAVAPVSLSRVQEAAGAVGEIRRLCEEKGVRLVVIAVPLSRQEWDSYDPEEVASFRRALAQTVDYYDCWGPSFVREEPRYFYDALHFRSDTGRMALAAVFGDETRFTPEGLCQLTTAENVEERVAQGGESAPETDYQVNVPILMYHAFTEDPELDTYTYVFSGDFEEQMAALHAAGYQTITYQDLIAYVDRGVPLPEKPLLISIDDGYRDNLALCAPVLEKYGFRATVAVIGVHEGKDTFKDTPYSMPAHFFLEEALPWMQKGVLELQSHTYDMHQEPSSWADGEDCREGVLKLPGETEEDYLRALREDEARLRERIATVQDTPCNVLVYPYGDFDTLAEVALHELGFRATVTIEDGASVILKGLSSSLSQLRRINVPWGTNADQVLSRVEAASTPGD